MIIQLASSLRTIGTIWLALNGISLQLTAVRSANTKVRFAYAPSFSRQLNLTVEVHQYQFSNELTSIKMKTLLFLALILCTASVGFAIKCQECASSTSMEDCKEKEKERDCGGSFDRCAKMSFEYKVGVLQTKVFGKGCSTKANCDANEQFVNCGKIEGATCEFDCCDSDGCNSSVMPVISAFLMVICTLVSMLY